MLKTLKVHNFKTFLNTELKFGQRHLLIGINNSGKTNLARLLHFLAATATHELDQAVTAVPGGIEEICNWKLKSDQIDISIVCALEYQGVPHNFTYDLRMDRGTPMGKQPGMRIVKESLSVTSESQDHALLENDGREAVMLDEDQAFSGDQSAAARSKTMAPKN